MSEEERFQDLFGDAPGILSWGAPKAAGPLTRETFWDWALDLYNQGRPRCVICDQFECECPIIESVSPPPHGQVKG